MTKKFKVGDKVRRVREIINHPSRPIGYVGVVTEIYSSIDVRLDGGGPLLSPDTLELVSLTTFEVGKKYVDEKGQVVEISGILLIAIDDNNVKRYYFPDGTDEFRTYPNLVSEYTPPPPEEWRAVYWRDNCKPEISSFIWTTKEAVETSERSHTQFMYAIRTDKGAMSSSIK